MNIAPPTPVHPDRRSALRLVFPPHRRPQLDTGDDLYPIIDAAPGGLRLRVADLGELHAGAELAGQVRLPGMHAPHAVAGHVRWVASTEVGVALDVQALPQDEIMRAIAEQRDRAEGD